MDREITITEHSVYTRHHVSLTTSSQSSPPLDEGGFVIPH